VFVDVTQAFISETNGSIRVVYNPARSPSHGINLSGFRGTVHLNALRWSVLLGGVFTVFFLKRLERSEAIERFERFEPVSANRDHKFREVEKGNQEKFSQKRQCLLTCLLMGNPAEASTAITCLGPTRSPAQ
jgi:hypothetical protein